LSTANAAFFCRHSSTKTLSLFRVFRVSRFIRTPGQGRLDFQAIYEACAEVGVENVLVEQDNAPKTPDPFAEMEFAYHHLRPIIH